MHRKVAQKNAVDFSTAFLMMKLHQAQNQGQNNPNQSDPLGGRSQHLIQAALLVLAQVGIGSTGQSTGQASLLAGLQQNDSDQADAGDNLQDDQNDLKNTH